MVKSPVSISQFTELQQAALLNLRIQPMERRDFVSEWSSRLDLLNKMSLSDSDNAQIAPTTLGLPEPWCTPLAALGAHKHVVQQYVPQQGNTCGDSSVAWSMLTEHERTHSNWRPHPSVLDFSTLAGIPAASHVFALQRRIRSMVATVISNWKIDQFVGSVPNFPREASCDGSEDYTDEARLQSLKQIARSDSSLNIAFFYIAADLLRVSFKIVAHDMRFDHLMPQLYDIAGNKYDQCIVLFLSRERNAAVGHFQPVTYDGQAVFGHDHFFISCLTAVAARWQSNDPTLHIHVNSANENIVHVDWPEPSDRQTIVQPEIVSQQPQLVPSSHTATPRSSQPIRRTHSLPQTVRSIPNESSAVQQLHQSVKNAIHDDHTACLKIASHGPLMLRLYKSNGPSWILQCRSLINRLARALDHWNTNPNEVNTCLAALLMLPAFVMKKPTRGGRRQLSADDVRSKRLQDMTMSERLRDAAENLWTDRDLPKHVANKSRAPSDPESSTNPNISSKSAFQDVKAALKCQQLLAGNYKGRAVRALTNLQDLADTTDPQVKQKLRDMHPARNLPLPPSPSASTDVIQVQSETVARLMHKSDNGSAPGPSGWGSNMLSLLAEDPQCVEGITMLVQHIVNNQLPPQSRAMLTTSSLVALGKKGGGVRPIAVGELFYRIAAQYAMFLIAADTEQAVGPYQYGVNKPNGCAQIIHSIQNMLTDESLACLSIDIFNAFNSVERAAIFSAVYNAPTLTPIRNITQFAYTHPSILVIRENNTSKESPALSFDTLSSDNGVRQGDALAAFLFSLTIRDALAQGADLCERRCLAYIDDGNFVGTPAQLIKVMDKVKECLAPLGLIVNERKSVLTCFGTLDDHTQALWDARGVPINNSTTTMLGALIGKDHDSIEQELDSDTSEWSLRREALYRRLPFLSTQNQMLILRNMNASMINHQLACMPPAATLKQAQKHDNMALNAAVETLGLSAPVDRAVTSQLMLPMSKGGCGILSARMTAAPAYLSAVFTSLSKAAAFATFSDGSTPLVVNSPLYSSIQFALDDAKSAHQIVSNDITGDNAPVDMSIDSDILPDSASTIVRFFNTHQINPIQATLSKRASNHIFSALEKRARMISDDLRKNFHLARLQSVQAEGSSRWMQVTPRERHLRLTDDEYRWATKLRLGVPVSAVADSDRCTGCNKSGAFGRDSWHYLSCSQFISRFGTMRHNAVALAITRYARLAGCDARHEPTRLSEDDEKRPDVEFCTLPKSTLIDVVISHPTAPSHQAAAKKGPLSVADEATKRKHKKYATMAQFQNATFNAFSCETYGGLSEEARKVVAQIADIAIDNGALQSRLSIINELLDEVAVHIQRGNAKMMHAGEVSRRRFGVIN